MVEGVVEVTEGLGDVVIDVVELGVVPFVGEALAGAVLVAT